MEFLAHHFVKVFESPDPPNIYTYTPGLCVLKNGNLLAALDLGGPGVRNLPGGVDYLAYHGHYSLGKGFLSSDGGKTWRHVVDFPYRHARPFVAGGSVYILGQNCDLHIVRSDDDGETWTQPVKLTRNERWHQSACNVWYKGDNVYLVMERMYSDGPAPDWPRLPNRWPVCDIAPVLLRGDVKTDLTQRGNWTFASRLRFSDVVDEADLDYHGIPYSPTSRKSNGGDGTMPAMGWLESNVVQIMDPRHAWYDPSFSTFHIFMRSHTGGTGYCALIKVVEQSDGSMETMVQTVPSGRKLIFLPMPGGYMRFHMLYDEKTRLYWLLSSQAFRGLQRQRLQLSFSDNCIDWCFAGMVDAVKEENASRHYASMVIDGDDLLVLSRSGDERALSAHDGNFISFHRISNFRDLVY